MEKESPSPVAILLICMHVVFLLFSYLSSPCTTSTDVYVVYIHRVKCFKLLRKLSKISTLLVKSFLFFVSESYMVFLFALLQSGLRMFTFLHALLPSLSEHPKLNFCSCNLLLKKGYIVGGGGPPNFCIACRHQFHSLQKVKLERWDHILFPKFPNRKKKYCTTQHFYV